MICLNFDAKPMLTTMTNKSEIEICCKFVSICFSNQTRVAPCECCDYVEHFCENPQFSTIRIKKKHLRVIWDEIGSNWVPDRWTVVGVICADSDGEKVFGCRKFIKSSWQLMQLSSIYLPREMNKIINETIFISYAIFCR